MLKEVFIQLGYSYQQDEKLALTLWKEIEKSYSSKKRHYHNLSHLSALINELTPCRQMISDWDILLFSIFYHDIVYKVLRSDNEEKSAELAVERLQQLGIEPGRIEKCRQQIIATKSHNDTGDRDTQLFTDADLSILGQSPDVYDAYCKQIRKEYSIYPDIVYNPGRKKVLDHFLKMEKIYKTDWFFSKYETTARLNLQRELQEL